VAFTVQLPAEQMKVFVNLKKKKLVEIEIEKYFIHPPVGEIQRG